MARLIPNTPAGEENAETLKVFRLLKRLPDEEFTVWHRLALTPEPRPDFWILRPDRRTLFLSVAADTPRDAQLTLQSSLLQSPSLDSTRTAALSAPKLRAIVQFSTQLNASLPTALAFPNLDTAEIKRVLPPQLPTFVYPLEKQQLNPETLAFWIERHLSPPLGDEMVLALHKAFTPEVIIPAQFTVRTPARNTRAQLTDYLLDYDQEWVLKNELALTPEGETTAREFGVHLVNGVAGSGKSLILLYRAHLLRQLYPMKKILVLTHNRALIRDLEARYRLLRERSAHSEGGSKEEPTDWKTFQGWCRQHWPPEAEWRKPIDPTSRQVILQRIWQKHLGNTALSPQMLQEEIDWYKDRLLFSREDYVRADRTGRGFALNEPTRHRIYDALETYARELKHNHWVDWGDVPRSIWQSLARNNARLPVYDIILIDEAQFFAPLWFEIIKQLLKPVTGHLFLSADPSQGFLQRRQSWLASGLDVRGHATYLPRCYRTTQEILSCATRFYQARLPEEDEDIVKPIWRDMPRGVVPEIIELTSEQDEITRVTHEIQALVAAGVPLEHILVIQVDQYGRKRLQQRLEKELGAGTAVDPARGPRGSHIRLCLLNGATGLESPIVFVVGLHKLLESELSLRLKDEERATLVRDNTRKLYMAMTRAGQRLVMTCVGDARALFPIPLQGDLP
jgi:hypothetical protein